MIFDHISAKSTTNLAKLAAGMPVGLTALYALIDLGLVRRDEKSGKFMVRHPRLFERWRKRGRRR